MKFRKQIDDVLTELAKACDRFECVPNEEASILTCTAISKTIQGDADLFSTGEVSALSAVIERLEKSGELVKVGAGYVFRGTQVKLLIQEK